MTKSENGDRKMRRRQQSVRREESEMLTRWNNTGGSRLEERKGKRDRETNGCITLCCISRESLKI